MHSKPRLVLAAVVLIALIAFLSYSNRAPKPGGGLAPDPVRVGAVLSLTGPVALLGVSSQRGIELAVEDINAAGGINGRELLVRFEDSEGVPAKGVSAVQKLLNVDHIDLVVTGLTGVSLAAKPVISARGGLQVSLAMDPTTADSSSNSFRIYADILAEGKAIMSWVRASGASRVAILHLDQQALNQQVREVLVPDLEDSGLELVALEAFRSSDLGSLRTLAAKIKDSAPDLIIANAYYSDLPAVFQVLHEYGLHRSATIVSGSNLAVAYQESSIDTSLLEGVGVVSPSQSIFGTSDAQKNPATSRFVEKYREHWGEGGSFDATFAYDSIRMLADAIEQVGVEPQDIAAYLRTAQGSRHEGVSGTIQLQPNGSARTDWQLGVFRDGAVESFPPSIGSTRGQPQPRDERTDD